MDPNKKKLFDKIISLDEASAKKSVAAFTTEERAILRSINSTDYFDNYYINNYRMLRFCINEQEYLVKAEAKAKHDRLEKTVGAMRKVLKKVRECSARPIVVEGPPSVLRTRGQPNLLEEPVVPEPEVPEIVVPEFVVPESVDPEPVVNEQPLAPRSAFPWFPDVNVSIAQIDIDEGFGEDEHALNDIYRLFDIDVTTDNPQQALMDKFRNSSQESSLQFPDSYLTPLRTSQLAEPQAILEVVPDENQLVPDVDTVNLAVNESQVSSIVQLPPPIELEPVNEVAQDVDVVPEQLDVQVQPEVQEAVAELEPNLPQPEGVAAPVNTRPAIPRHRCRPLRKPINLPPGIVQDPNMTPIMMRQLADDAFFKEFPLLRKIVGEAAYDTFEPPAPPQVPEVVALREQFARIQNDSNPILRLRNAGENTVVGMPLNDLFRTPVIQASPAAIVGGAVVHSAPMNVQISIADPTLVDQLANENVSLELPVVPLALPVVGPPLEALEDRLANENVSLELPVVPLALPVVDPPLEGMEDRQDQQQQPSVEAIADGFAGIQIGGNQNKSREPSIKFQLEQILINLELQKMFCKSETRKLDFNIVHKFKMHSAVVFQHLLGLAAYGFLHLESDENNRPIRICLGRRPE